MNAGATRIKVPVTAAVVIAWRAVFGRFGLVLELGWLPLLVMLGALLLPGLAIRYLAPAGQLPTGGALDDAAAVFDAGVALLALNAFAVRWHRLMLLGELSPPPQRVFARAWLRFIGYSVAVYAAGLGFFALVWYAGLARPAGTDQIAAIKSAAVAALGVALSLGVARFSLVFPAAAFGAPVAPGTAWRAMRGNAWRLLLASLVGTLPIMLATGILLDQLLAVAHLGPAELIDKRPPLGLILLTGVIEALLRLVLMALSASILAEFYRRLVLQRGEGRR